MSFKKVINRAILLGLLFSFTVFSLEKRVVTNFDNINDFDSIKTNDAGYEIINLPGTSYGNVMKIDFGMEEKLPSVSFLCNGAGWNFSDYVYVSVDVYNRDTVNSVQVFGYLNGIRRGNGVIDIEPGEMGTLKIILCRTNNSLDQNLKNYLGQKFNGFMGGCHLGFTPNADTINSITIHVVSPRTQQSIIIDNIRAEEEFITNQIDTNTLTPFIDRYGQLSNSFKTWPGKTESDNDLKNDLINELEDLEENKGPDNWNKYGGWKSGPNYGGTGHFRVQKIDGKWWFIDPDGYLFWANGITGLHHLHKTPVSSPWHNFQKYYVGEADIYIENGYVYYQHYKTNLRRKFQDYMGEPYSAEIMDVVRKRLKSWGLNTMVTSNHEFSNALNSVYTFQLSSGVQGFTKENYLDPQLWSNLRANLINQMDSIGVGTVNDPWCLGYYVDIETWFSQNFTEEEVGLIADNYYRICDSIVDSYTDSSKLFLGSKTHFYSETSEHLRMSHLTAMAKHCDVISLNRYSFTMRDLDVLTEDYGPDTNVNYDKPIIIGEFHFGALDRGLDWTGLRTVQNQQQRGEMYKSYITDCLEHPNLIGVEWFQYVDQAYSTRGFGSGESNASGENAQIGWVDICDKPYQEMVDAAREVNYSTYEVRRYSWITDKQYSRGDTVIYNGEYYSCNSGHVSVKNIRPGMENASMWVLLNEFVNDWTLNVSYNVGDRVQYDGRVWECRIGNTAQGHNYPGVIGFNGWELVYSDGHCLVHQIFEPSVTTPVNSQHYLYNGSIWEARNNPGSWSTPSYDNNYFWLPVADCNLD